MDFKTASLVRAIGTGNLLGGINSLAALTTGTQNTGFGFETLKATVTDTYSTAVGHQALLIATAHANTAFGAGAGGSVSTGYDGLYVGADCGRNADASGNMTGDNNVGFGVHALGHVTSGRFNVAIGNYSMVGGGLYIGAPTALLTGSYNVALGHIALGNIQGDANENVALGYSAGSGLSTGDENIFLGAYAGDDTTTGDLNIIIGRDVQASGATASNELNIGNLLTATGLTQGGAAAAGALTVHGTVTVDPAAIPLTLKTNTAGGAYLFYGASAAGGNVTGNFNASRGTVAVPTVVVSADNLATPVLVKGYDGAAYQTAAKIVVQVATTVSSGIVPGSLQFYTTNTSGVNTLGLSINHNQNSTFAAALTATGLFTASAGVTVASGQTLKLGNAATTGLVAGVLAATTNASIVLTDSGGQAYRIPCII